MKVKITKNELGWKKVKDLSFHDFKNKYLQYLKTNVRSITYVKYKKTLQHFTDFLKIYGNLSSSEKKEEIYTSHMSQEYRYKAKLKLILQNLLFTITLGKILKNKGII